MRKEEKIIGLFLLIYLVADILNCTQYLYGWSLADLLYFNFKSIVYLITFPFDFLTWLSIDIILLLVLFYNIQKDKIYTIKFFSIGIFISIQMVYLICSCILYSKQVLSDDFSHFIISDSRNAIDSAVKFNFEGLVIANHDYGNQFRLAICFLIDFALLVNLFYKKTKS
jgi:hypothetical protein